MSDYDNQYEVETELFGAPYAEFEAFVAQHAKVGGTALDIGCGQGRDALMLAKHGYAVTGVDASQVGIEQMVARAKRAGLSVDGVVADFFAHELSANYDAIVLDSILHFGKNDKAKELALLDRLIQHLNADGFLCLFVHKSPAKERELKRWAEKVSETLAVFKEGYVDYVYRESVSGFESAFQYYMLILQQR